MGTRESSALQRHGSHSLSSPSGSRGASARRLSGSDLITRSIAPLPATARQTDTPDSSLGVIMRQSPRDGLSTSPSTPGLTCRAGMSGLSECVEVLGQQVVFSRETDRYGYRMNQSSLTKTSARLSLSKTEATTRVVLTVATVVIIQEATGALTTQDRRRQAVWFGTTRRLKAAICQVARMRTAIIWDLMASQDTSVARVAEATSRIPVLPTAPRRSSSSGHFALERQQRHCTNRPVTTPMSHEWWPFGVLGNMLRLRTGRRMRNGACRK